MVNEFSNNCVVQPIYGWGWFDKKGDSISVPASFRLEISENKIPETIFGKINQPNHDYDGWWAILEIRSKGDEANMYNVLLTKVRPSFEGGKIDKNIIEVTGFSKLVNG